MKYAMCQRITQLLYCNVFETWLTLDIVRPSATTKVVVTVSLQCCVHADKCTEHTARSLLRGVQSAAMDLVSAKQDAADTKSVQHCPLECDSQRSAARY